MKEEEMLLEAKDFEGLKIDTDQPHIGIFAQVCCVGLQKLLRLKQKQVEDQSTIQSSPQPSDEKADCSSRRSSRRATKISRKSQEEPARDSSKRPNDDDENEDDDNWVVVNNVQRENKSKNNKSKRAVRRRKSFVFVRPAEEAVAVEGIPDLPEIFRRRIVEEMEGEEVTLVIQKKLTVTDLNPNHNRLSMPFTMIKGWDFLRDHEKARLRAKAIMAVPMIEPQPLMMLTEVILRQWDMAKSSGKTSSSYVLRTAWQHVVLRNRLAEDEVVQVWSFRVQDRLHLALVVASRQMPPPPVAALAEQASSSGSGGGGGGGAGAVGEDEAAPASLVT